VYKCAVVDVYNLQNIRQKKRGTGQEVVTAEQQSPLFFVINAFPSL
jgi:hypothetical protein